MELLYALGIAILLVLAVRAIQWFRESQRRLRVKLEKVPPGPEIEETRYSELGKVRVRPRFGNEPEQARPAEKKPALVVRPALAAVTDSSLSASSEVNFDAEPEIPVLSAESAWQASSSASAHAVKDDTARDVGRVDESGVVAEAALSDEGMPVLLTPAAVQPELPAIEQHDMFADEPISLPPSRKTETTPSRASILYEKTVEPVRPVAVVEEEKVHVDVQDVIALHVVARAHLFSGEDLLRSILAYGLRFGEMAIFHRHEQPTGQGRILFSMAKAVEPGTFDLEAMTGDEIPGVSFFLSLPGINSIHAYDIMVDTVKRLATELNGEVLDEQQQVLTRQLIEHYRERVQEFERRRLMNRPSV